MAKIYYVGEWSALRGPRTAETPFDRTGKGSEVDNHAAWLASALESSGEHQVSGVPAGDFDKLGPGEYEKVLAEFDVVIFSDVESKHLQLAPSFFDRAKFGTQVLSFPDRVRLSVEAVHHGKGMMFLGGRLSFNGECGKGGWGRTGLKEILPVRCLEVEDLRESSEGYRAEPVVAGHPCFNQLDLHAMPLVLGYNIVDPRDGCPVLARWQGTNDPLLAVGQFGKGRVLCYTSNPASHWGCNFVYWERYNRFWTNACNWVLHGR